jgi:hypothetical protein
MGLDMWFKADVARILRATSEAMQATAAASGGLLPGYGEGFGAALRAVAAGFGLEAARRGEWSEWSAERSDRPGGEPGPIVEGQLGHAGRALSPTGRPLGEAGGEAAVWKGVQE